MSWWFLSPNTFLAWICIYSCMLCLSYSLQHWPFCLSDKIYIYVEFLFLKFTNILFFLLNILGVFIGITIMTAILGFYHKCMYVITPTQAMSLLWLFGFEEELVFLVVRLHLIHDALDFQLGHIVIRMFTEITNLVQLDCVRQLMPWKIQMSTKWRQCKHKQVTDTITKTTTKSYTICSESGLFW